MTLRIQQAVTEGISLAASRNGALLVVAVFLVDLIGAVVAAVATSGIIPLDAGLWAPMEVATTPPVRTVAMSLAVVFNLLLALPVYILAIRLFVAGVTDGIPDAFLTDRIGRATLSGVGATLVWSLLIVGIPLGVGAATAIGYGVLTGTLATLFFWGGVLTAVAATTVVAVAFFFILHEIGIRHRRLFGAFRGSYRIVRGQFGRVTLLLALFAGIYITLGWGATLIGDQPWTGLRLGMVVLSWLLAALAAVFTTAVVSCAYRQIHPEVDGTTIVSTQPAPQGSVFSRSENKR